jgi:hypothetical protein
MTRGLGPVTRYDLAVEAWNKLNTTQRTEKRAECWEQGHDWHRLPGSGGWCVCLRCIAYLEPAERLSA